MARPSSFDRADALAKARDLFWRKGFHATSLKDLETALALKPGSIYGAFGNKEALYRESLALYMRDSILEFSDRAERTGSPLAALAEFVRSFADCRSTGLPTNACMVVKTMLELSNDGPEDLAREANKHLDAMALQFETMFERARALGEVADDLNPRRAALKLQAGITGLRAMAESTRSDADMFALAEDLADEVERLRT